MSILEIKGFSCLSKATLEPRDLTLIVGPQASGKSLLCKLSYFFNRFYRFLPYWMGESTEGPDIQTRVLEEFTEWFQVSSWGSRPFEITLISGPYEISIVRSGAKSKSKRDPAKIVVSNAVSELIDALESAKKGLKEKKTGGPRQVETWRLHSIFSELIVKMMGKHLPSDQLFVPAGRSFFTSVGKIVTAFDDRSMLDPVVANFGRLVTSLRDDPEPPMDDGSELLQPLQNLLAGKVKHERGKQSFVTSDGRSLAFSALSSGQQELLPLLYALRYSTWSERERLLYIEEPEAHLFPSAQAALIEMFAAIVNYHGKSGPNTKRPRTKRRIVLTTHSPYVLAKVNNLIKAGQLAETSPELKKSLREILPEETWLKPGAVSAYAIDEGVLTPIMDESGLVNGDYIDSVSSSTGREFERMIELELL